MRAQLDAIGNVCGRYEGERPNLPCLMLGVALRHRPRCRQMGRAARAGHGNLLRRRSEPARAAAAVRGRGDRLRRRGRGAFRLHALGQPRAVAGTFVESVLGAKDSDGVSMRDALIRFGLDPDHIGAAARAASELLAYVELHIEQGPVLEGLHLPVGVVSAIAGATRLAASLTGMAGTCRHRADAAAARRAGGGGGNASSRSRNSAAPTRTGWSAPSATSMRCRARPTSFPGRPPSPSTSAHRRTRTASWRWPTSSAGSRPSRNAGKLKLQLDVTHENRTVPCAPWLKSQVADAVAGEGFSRLRTAERGGA